MKKVLRLSQNQIPLLQMDESWKIVFTDTFLPKVELVKALLAEHDVPAIILNQQDSAHKTFGEIQLLVHRENYLKAFHLIKPTRE